MTSPQLICGPISDSSFSNLAALSLYLFFFPSFLFLLQHFFFSVTLCQCCLSQCLLGVWVTVFFITLDYFYQYALSCCICTFLSCLSLNFTPLFKYFIMYKIWTNLFSKFILLFFDQVFVYDKFKNIFEILFENIFLVIFHLIFILINSYELLALICFSKLWL